MILTHTHARTHTYTHTLVNMLHWQVPQRQPKYQYTPSDYLTCMHCHYRLSLWTLLPPHPHVHHPCIRICPKGQS